MKCEEETEKQRSIHLSSNKAQHGKRNWSGKDIAHRKGMHKTL